MKFTIWIIMIGLCLLCVGCNTTGSSSDDSTPGLGDFNQVNSTPNGGAEAAEFARKTY